MYASYLGGAAEDRAVGVAFAAGKTHIVGNTRSANFPKVTPIINGLVGAQDAFAAKVPGIEATSAPALSGLWLVLVAAALLAIGGLLLNARRPANCRSAR